MTSPHIEAIARKLDPNAFHPDPIKAHQLCSPESAPRRRQIAISLATLAFAMSAEICANEAHGNAPRCIDNDWDEGHNAGVEMCVASIRALIQKEVG